MVNKKINSQNKIIKESIFTALMILMENKYFRDISITELTKKAGVSRMSFYRNYNSMEDIITTYLDELFEEYSLQISSHEKNNNFDSVCLYFAYFRKHKKLITNLINANLTNLIFDRYVKFFHSFSKDFECKKLHSPEIDKYSVEFVSGGLYKVLIEWTKNGMKESDEDMAKMIYDLFLING
ncbi:TetR/AcrR family transcriptional regulator [Clostridium sp. YIM B02500]|uniref:TetR/AcrR family transcriptional regulator n=1 Tax=Clostridium sp. YIM B02500 TaxID=2910681 RepID=UPI001EEEAED5|nr:TetR/AcrR family transcriptional regulator [Clostridium sp. YIM B02500]